MPKPKARKSRAPVPIDGMTLDQLKEDLAAMGATQDLEELTKGVTAVNAPPPGMPDPMKLSRMIRVLSDYVQEGLIEAPERPFKTMTEGELEDLIEAARHRKSEKENPNAEEPEGEGEEPEEESPEEAARGAGQPRPKVNKIAGEAEEARKREEAQPKGEEPVSEEGGISEQDFKDRYPIGQQIEYNGEEYVVTGHSKTGAEGLPSFDAIEIGEEESFDTEEHDDGSIAIKESPTKIPQKTEYPAQVFLLARVVEGMAVAEIYLNHQALTAAHPDIDGDAIMEAISDPGEPQGIDGGTINFTSID
jgi:hypothetical protein